MLPLLALLTAFAIALLFLVLRWHMNLWDWHLWLALPAALLLAAPLVAAAQPLGIDNAGFEANPAAPGAFIVGLPNGWSAYDPAGILERAARAAQIANKNGGNQIFS